MIGRRPMAQLAVAASLALLAAACASNTTTQGGAGGSAAASPTGEQMLHTPPLISGYFDGKAVTYLLTDVSTQKDATALTHATNYPVSYAPKLGTVPENDLAKLYLFMNGVAGPNPFGFQANVLDSVPGDSLYSPLWRVYAVTWNDGTTPRVLTSAQKIHHAEMVTHEITITKTDLVKDSPVVSAEPPIISGYYKGKPVDYVLTDVSTRKDATALSAATGFPVDYVPKLGRVPERDLAKLYLFMNGVAGPNPFGFQANVVDSVPGDPGYSPLWRVYAVTWNPGATPRLLTSAQEIHDAEMVTHEITVARTGLVKNSPIVGYKGS